MNLYLRVAICLLLGISTIVVAQSQCGNANLQTTFPYFEDCDDGNRNNGDGCSRSCNIEVHWNCTGEPSICKPICGDSILLGNETCDDGNNVVGDGCDVNCLIEIGWNCTGVPSVCEEIGDTTGGGGKAGIAAGVIIGLLIVVGVVVAIIVVRKRRPDIVQRLSQRFPKSNKAVNLQADETGSAKNTSGKNSRAESEPSETSMNSRTETSRSESTYPLKQGPPPKPAQPVTVQKPALMSSMDGGSDYRSSPKVGRPSQYPATADYSSKGTTRTSTNTVFGIPIDQVRTINNVPNVLEETIKYLEKTGLDEEGILRLAGSANEIKQLKSVYDSGQTPDFTKCSDIQSVAGLLKLYLRELPRPLLLMTSGLKAIIDSEDSSSQIDSLIAELNNVPEVNYYTMKRLFGFLHQVTQHSSKNKMTSSNLAIVFHPTLQISMELLEIMISNSPSVFVY